MASQTLSFSDFIRNVPNCRFEGIERTYSPEEVARLVLWLASDENTFVSAQNIAIDGGFTSV